MPRPQVVWRKYAETRRMRGRTPRSDSGSGHDRSATGGASLPDRAGPVCVAAGRHGSCASRTGDGVLLIGPPGVRQIRSVVLRLLARGFELVADDQVDIEDGIARPPPRLGRAAGSPRPRHRAAALAAQARLALVVELGSTRRTNAGARANSGLRSAAGAASTPPPRPPRNASPSRSIARSAASARSPEPSPHEQPNVRRVVLVTGLSGGGKASILRALEDIGYEAVDNPPLTMIEEMVARSERPLAVGVDARTRGFDAALVLEAFTRLRANPALRPELVFAWADEATLLRRYTETRRRHPLAPQGRGHRRHRRRGSPDRPAARACRPGDRHLRTCRSPALRQLIERHFGTGSEARQPDGGVAGFLRLSPWPAAGSRSGIRCTLFAEPALRSHIAAQDGAGSRTVGAYIAADPDFAKFFSRLAELIELLLPRFVQEGKKYATITIGCTGGGIAPFIWWKSWPLIWRSRIAADAGGQGARH